MLDNVYFAPAIYLPFGKNTPPYACYGPITRDNPEIYVRSSGSTTLNVNIKIIRRYTSPEVHRRTKYFTYEYIYETHLPVKVSCFHCEKYRIKVAGISSEIPENDVWINVSEIGQFLGFI